MGAHGTVPWSHGTIGPRDHGPWALRAHGRALRARWAQDTSMFLVELRSQEWFAVDCGAPKIRSIVSKCLLQTLGRLSISGRTLSHTDAGQLLLDSHI